MRLGVAPNRKLREFVINATVDPDGRRDRFSEIDVNLAPLLLDGRVRNREGDGDTIALFVDLNEVHMIVERIVCRLCPGFEREAEQARARPAQSPDCLVAAGLD